MAIPYEEKSSQSPLDDVVFQIEDLTDGVYIASAESRWDIIFTVSEVVDELDYANSKVNATKLGMHMVEA